MALLRYYERDLSWLSFNERVLQESGDKSVPLIERLRFLAIFSSNLDEFYRVRVSGYRYLMRLGKQKKLTLQIPPDAMVERINRTSHKLQEQFGRMYRAEIIPLLRKEGIWLADDLHALYQHHIDYLKQVYFDRIKPELEVNVLGVDQKFQPENRAVYLVFGKKGSEDLFLIKVPVEVTGRFCHVPDPEKYLVVQMDDIIRYFAYDLLGEGYSNGHAIKVSRDAELYLEDELEGNIVERIRKSLEKRESGDPTRFLYDENMPASILKKLRKLLNLNREDMVAGGHYHNFHEFFDFPDPEDKPHLSYKPLKPIKHPELYRYESIFDIIQRGDQMLHVPYHAFNPIIDFLNEAAVDPKVKRISITLYRVAKDSAVGDALAAASKNGVDVVVFDEVKARFDEQANLQLGKKLEDAGVRVYYSFEDLKVHCKCILIEREVDGELQSYSYLGTGNFNEKTAGIYCDHGLFTANPEIGDDMREVFGFLKKRKKLPRANKLLVAPHQMRDRFGEMIEREIKFSREGKSARITLKLNSLEDREMITRLYRASNEGVKIRIIVRGICCLIPGVPGMSENIKVRSIVDRFLEHARIFIFENAGDPEYYMSSADWMTRNLSRRIEVGFPILDPDLKQEIQDIMDIQRADNTKARKINIRQTNPYIKNRRKSGKVRAQYATYKYLLEKSRINMPPEELEVEA